MAHDMVHNQHKHAPCNCTSHENAGCMTWCTTAQTHNLQPHATSTLRNPCRKHRTPTRPSEAINRSVRTSDCTLATSTPPNNTVQLYTRYPKLPTLLITQALQLGLPQPAKHMCSPFTLLPAAAAAAHQVSAQHQVLCRRLTGLCSAPKRVCLCLHTSWS